MAKNLQTKGIRFKCSSASGGMCQQIRPKLRSLSKPLFKSLGLRMQRHTMAYLISKGPNNLPQLVLLWQQLPESRLNSINQVEPPPLL